LNFSYGFGNLDPSVILTQLRDIRFHPSKDPSTVLNDIDIKFAELESTGSTISDSQMIQYIHDGLSGDHLRDAFWFNCKGAMNITGLNKFTVETAGQYIVKFWYAYKPKKVAEVANLSQEKKKYEKRFCQNCKDEGREKIRKTHNTKFCRFKKEENDSSNTAASQENKEESNYSLYHDSGTSKTMLNFKPPIPIRTAGANQKPQYATSRGVFKLGSEEIETFEVPTFSKSLLSATQLSIEHGCKQVIEP